MGNVYGIVVGAHRASGGGLVVLLVIWGGEWRESDACQGLI